MQIQIYTDGSCHTQQRVGGWAAIILWKKEKIELKGFVKDTTHNAMEILAVLKALDFLEKNNNNTFTKIEIVSDSQYVVRILERKEKLKAKSFLTKKGNLIRNVELVKKLIERIETLPLIFTKIKAHQKATDKINYNRVVDHLARNEVRKIVNLNH
ncbi:MAG: ribonuclease H [Saprospiraceae bacterium]